MMQEIRHGFLYCTTLFFSILLLNVFSTVNSYAQCDSLVFSIDHDSLLLCNNDSNATAGVFIQPVQTLLISEMSLGDIDFIEITNVSGVSLNIDGYYVAVSNSYSSIDSVNPIRWNLSGTVPHAWVDYREDDSLSVSNAWGNDLLFERSSPGWILIFDSTDIIVDALFWGWTAADILAFSPQINGNTVSLGSQWQGDGVNAVCNDIYNRSTNIDSDNLFDWGCIPSSKLTVAKGVLNLSFFFPTLLWSTGDTAQVISGLSAGIHSIIITDVYGCPHFDTIIVSEPPQLSTFEMTLDALCSNDNSGSATVSASGGTGSLVFNWGSADPAFLPAGPAFYTVSDSNNCLFSDSVFIHSPPPVTSVLASLGNILCFGDSMGGMLSASLSGGTPGYSLLWSTGDSSMVITGLNSGTYSLVITDNNSCIFSDSFFVSQPAAVSSSVIADDVPCFGDTTGGTAVVSAAGGVSGYTFLWNTGSTFPSVSDLGQGTYFVTVTDSNACSSISSAVISAPALLTGNNTFSNVLCLNGNSGSAAVMISGGTPAYNYVWSNSETSSVISALIANTYYVTVTDDKGCLFRDSVVVSAPLTSAINTFTVTNVLCSGESSGALSVLSSGGTPAYSYLWSNTPVDTSIINEIPAGIYMLTTTDNNGCTNIDTVQVAEPALLSGNFLVTDTPCEDSLAGEISIVPTGGSSGFSYLWSDGSSGSDISGIAAGIYSVTLSDNNGCTFIGADTVLSAFRPLLNCYAAQSPTVDTIIQWDEELFISAGYDQTADSVVYLWEEISSVGNIIIDEVAAPFTTVNPSPLNDVSYLLKLTATSADACVSTCSLTVHVSIDDLIGMPDAFSPNSDNINDYFYPVGLDNKFILEFLIFNRWGQTVFNGVESVKGWDGRFLNREQAQDTYIYFLRYQLPGQQERLLKGDFILIR